MKKLNFIPPTSTENQAKNWEHLMANTKTGEWVPTTTIAGVDTTLTRTGYFILGPICWFSVSFYGTDITTVQDVSTVYLPTLPDYVGRATNSISAPCSSNTAGYLGHFYGTGSGNRYITAGFSDVVAGSGSITIQGWYFREVK